MLGDTLEKIAFEKAGIIKRNVPIVIGEIKNETRSVFIDVSEKMNAPIYLASYAFSAEYSSYTDDFRQIFNINKGGEIIYSGMKTDLTGLYQKKNIVTAIQAIEIMKDAYDLTSEIIYEGILNVKKNTGLRGRWEVLQKTPLIICDTGHNEDGISEVVKQMQLISYKKLHFVIGTVNDKDIDKILSLLPKNAIYYFTKADIPRALSEKILQAQASDFKLFGDSYPTVKEAFEAAKKAAEPDDFIFVGGSTFVVAEVI
jgi:dihydrofolate synthase/folylpolyglutamate synthase